MTAPLWSGWARRSISPPGIRRTSRSLRRWTCVWRRPFWPRGGNRHDRTAGRTRVRRPPSGTGEASDLRRCYHPVGEGVGRPLRCGRADPCGDGCPAGRCRYGRYRETVPGLRQCLSEHLQPDAAGAGDEGPAGVPAPGVYQPCGRDRIFPPADGGELPGHRRDHAGGAEGGAGGEGLSLHLRRCAGGLSGEEILFGGLWSTESAAVHPEGCGGPHGGPYHREL